MKRIILATALAALFSANLMAATEITSHQADQRQSVGFVTLNQNVVSPDDASSRQQNRRSTRRKLLSHHRPARTGRQQHDARQRRAVPLKAHATPKSPGFIRKPVQSVPERRPLGAPLPSSEFEQHRHAERLARIM